MLSRILINGNKTITNATLINKRHFWGWINIIFNKVDEDRKKAYGADRVCAEWLLRNGASVKWTNSTEYLSDYNSLPIEGTKLLISEVDASDSSIMHYGFPHFIGCKHINKIILHNCSYLENPALEMLGPLNGILKYLQVSSCNNLDESGLRKLANLNLLEKLVIANIEVKNRDDFIMHLKENLTKCSIEFN